MENKDLFLVIEHINNCKNNKYHQLRKNQLYSGGNSSKKSGIKDRNQLSLLEANSIKNEESTRITSLKIVN